MSSDKLHSLQSLPTRVAEVLRRGFAEGRWRGHLPGERRLCVQLGVSRPTLRAALAQLRRKGLLKTAHGRRSHATRKAGSASAIETPRTLLALTPESPARLSASVLRTLDELREHLAECSLRLDVRQFLPSRAQQPDRALATMIAEKQPAACLLYQAPRAVHRWFYEQRLPCVVYGTQDPAFPLPALDTDFRAATRHAANVLLRRGCAPERIVLLLPRGELPGNASMREGLAEAIGGRARVVELRTDPAACCAAIDKLAIERGGKPWGLISARAGHAVAALGHLAVRRCIRVPSTVALISLADDPFLHFVQPALAHYRRDEADFSRKLTAIVARAARGATPSPRMTLLMPDFVKGETVS